MAPAAFISHSPHPLGRLFAREVKAGLLRDFKYLDLSSVWDVGKDFSSIFCTTNFRTTLALCRSVIFIIVGPNRQGVEIDDVRLWYGFWWGFKGFHFRVFSRPWCSTFRRRSALCKSRTICSCSWVEDSRLTTISGKIMCATIQRNLQTTIYRMSSRQCIFIMAATICWSRQLWENFCDVISEIIQNISFLGRGASERRSA